MGVCCGGCFRGGGGWGLTIVGYGGRVECADWIGLGGGGWYVVGGEWGLGRRGAGAGGRSWMVGGRSEGWELVFVVGYVGWVLRGKGFGYLG